MSEYRRIDVIEIAPGRFVEIGSVGTDVLLWVPGADVLLRFDGDARDKFIKAYALAEMDAEKAEAAQPAGMEA